ncbi:MAG: CehA/McbA family metallohydrolase [Acidobacteria bacterium]|nr:CehA/McbA family metallohydrolase [Acidobacteriota bacterium]MDA1234341.1 CehA/McbA family metallohydrolase [Acidobacteriota bacterium]
MRNRRTWIARTAIATAFLAALAWMATAQTGVPAGHWYKGNLHTHTINSDGDTSPDDVVRWYKEHRYDFLSLTAHNFLTETGGLSGVFGAKGKFLLLPGEEVTSRYSGKPIHINALDVRSLIEPATGTSVVDTIQQNVDRIHAANSLASLNHPNFGWAITTDELRQVNGLKLFEVYNGHPTVNNQGGGGQPGLEEMWDSLLTAGRRIHGIAVDDAHHFKTLGQGYSNPGRGWVMVKAAELSVATVRAALENGDFYASTGVVLEDAERLPNGLRLRLPQTGTTRFTTQFIGANGEVLATSIDAAPEYRLKAGQPYVRAVVTDSNGWQAWVQPVFAD